jgi:hypothetical protein
MKVPSSTAIDTADDPITSCRSWNQTTSYISAAQPLPTTAAGAREGTGAASSLSEGDLSQRTVVGKTGMVSHGI